MIHLFTPALVYVRVGENEGHVPDIIRKNAADNGMHELFESKVYTAAKTTNNKGGGTAKGVTRAAARPRPLRLRAATLR